ncbi:hypothetical protein [Ideonella sp.]|uniref:hypothetical protein n=1 Tax=Ideonella sp. TaxID=1929293 RepID=UPI003BB4F492
MNDTAAQPSAVSFPFFRTQRNIMFNQASKTSFTLARQCLVPMLLLGTAAQASAVELNTDTVTFALCRNESGAMQYTQNKDGTWNALSSTGSSSKLTYHRSDANLFSLIYANGKLVEINLHMRTCGVRSVDSPTKHYTLEVSAAL